MAPEKMAVRLLFQQATTARRLAPSADPPLNPSQPNHRRMVPRVIKDTLWGLKLRSIFSWRLPRTKEYARAPTPDAISTGPPPINTISLIEPVCQSVR